jgi:3-hydroxyacyl-[acyl-carrier-protein] dehydratase
LRFLFVDEILELVPGQRVTAVKTLSREEDFFADHFPGFPVVPGVLLTEMMAQVAGKCLDAEKRPRGKAMLAQITKASFRRWVEPDLKALIRADIKTNRDQYATATCHVEVGGEIICSAELMFSFVPMVKFSSRFRDDVLEDFLLKEGHGDR